MAKTQPKKSAASAVAEQQRKSETTKDLVKTGPAKSDEAGRKKDSGKKSR